MKTEKDPRKLTPVGAIVLVNTVDGEAFTAAESINKTGWNGIRKADVVLGPYDIFIHAEAPTPEELGEGIVQHIHLIPGVKSTLALLILNSPTDSIEMTNDKKKEKLHIGDRYYRLAIEEASRYKRYLFNKLYFPTEYRFNGPFTEEVSYQLYPLSLDTTVDDIEFIAITMKDALNIPHQPNFLQKTQEYVSQKARKILFSKELRFAIFRISPDFSLLAKRNNPKNYIELTLIPHKMNNENDIQTIDIDLPDKESFNNFLIQFFEQTQKEKDMVFIPDDIVFQFLQLHCNTPVSINVVRSALYEYAPLFPVLLKQTWNDIPEDVYTFILGWAERICTLKEDEIKQWVSIRNGSDDVEWIVTLHPITSQLQIIRRT